MNADVAATPTPPVRLGLLDTFEVAYGANLIGCTIMRIRGIVWLATDPASSSVYRMGVKINDNRTPPDASENLFVSSEIGGAHDDWMGWYSLAGGVTSTGQQPSDLVRAREVDIRSMRKLDELGQRLELYFSGLGGIAGQASIGFDLSTLVALP